MRWMTLACALAALCISPATAQPRNAYEQEAAAAVQRHVDAYRSWDLDRFVDTFAVDATVQVDGKSAKGHSQIRAFYARNFADPPHTIRILESGIRRGMVFMTVAYTFADGSNRCCSYSEYFVQNGKIMFLTVRMESHSSSSL